MVVMKEILMKWRNEMKSEYCEMKMTIIIVILMRWMRRRRRNICVMCSSNVTVM